MTVVRFAEMNFEHFHQQSQPYAFRFPEKFSTLTFLPQLSQLATVV